MFSAKDSTQGKGVKTADTCNKSVGPASIRCAAAQSSWKVQVRGDQLDSGHVTVGRAGD